MDKKWWKESVVYQIYPKSFCDSNGDGIGDIPGIISKLDYLKELGINVIWLSPIYQSPNDDNGYDISDYQAIMADFGTMTDFDMLLNEAHKRNIKIIMDLVVNHTSDEHKWFIESKASTDTSYRDYYIWKEGKDNNPPNNWGSWFGGSAWEYDGESKMYYLHIFSKKQPDLNWENEQVRNAIFEMMTWWLDKGIDGFRMDVISLISKIPEMPDGEMKNEIYGDLAPYCINGPRVHEYLKEMNQKVLSKYDIMTVGEATGVTLEEAKKYAGNQSNELDMVFQFEHVDVQGLRGKWTNKRFQLRDLKQVMNKWQTGLAGIGWNTLFWSNHDQPRAVSRFGNDGPYRELSAKMLATCLHMMQGTPYIFQGEELGMTNAGFGSLEDYRDIESINAYEEYVNILGIDADLMIEYLKNMGRDNARTPMQWDDSKHAGFTKGTPWIKVNDNYREINARQQLEDPNSVFYYYRDLIRLRQKHTIIIYGEFKMLMPESEEVFAYKRTLDRGKLYVFCNFTEQEILYEVPKSTDKVLISNYKDGWGNMLRAYEAIVYIE